MWKIFWVSGNGGAFEMLNFIMGKNWYALFGCMTWQFVDESRSERGVYEPLIQVAEM